MTEERDVLARIRPALSSWVTCSNAIAAGPDGGAIGAVFVPFQWSLGLRRGSAELLVLELELGDAAVQRLEDALDCGCVEFHGNVLRTVDVPGLHLEEDGALRARGVPRGREAAEQRRITLDHPRPAPELHSPPLRIVHREEEGPLVLGEVAEGDILPIASKVGEAEPALVEYAQEAARSAPVLQVGLAGGTGGGEVDAVALGQEGRQLRRDPGLPAVALLDAPVAGARAAAGLLGLDGGGEGNVAGQAAGHRGLHSLRQRGGSPPESRCRWRRPH